MLCSGLYLKTITPSLLSLNCFKIGTGYNSMEVLSNKIYTFETKGSNGAWKELEASAGNWAGLSHRLQLAGHTAVVNTDLNMLIVFGGFTLRRNT